MSGENDQQRLGQCRNHSVCHGCQHTKLSQSDTSDTWCYMFKDGAFLDSQGYCAQFKIPSSSPVEPMGAL
mgnify:CR=1 FL=1|jgi:hypothetical protein